MDHHTKSAATAPLASPLQIDQAMAALQDAGEAHIAAVRALLDRLAPVSQQLGVIVGSFTINGDGNLSAGIVGIGKEFSFGKAPLASAIDARRTSIADLTKEVQAATAALQI